MKKLLVFLFVALTTCTKYNNTPQYDIIENKKYDAGVKSQISLRVSLVDSTASDDQVKELVELLAHSSTNIPMKKHPKPTHIFVYVYKTKASYEANSGSWLAMFSKIGADDAGKYTYQLPADTIKR